MSTSASTSSGEKASLPATDEIKEWDTDELIDFLRKYGLKLKEIYFTTLKDQEVTGSSFLSLTVEILIQKPGPFELPYGPAQDIVNFVKKLRGEEQATGTSSITNEIVTKIDAILEKLTEENTETVSFSSINLEKFNRLLMRTGLDIIPLTFTKKRSSKDIVAYQWSNHAENFSEQRDQILGYLNKHLNPHLPENIVVFDVSGLRDFLNITDNPLLPFNVRGGTDLILVE
ncbi:hypothetical protein C2G38_1432728, partial [Gigaspora rosea]